LVHPANDALKELRGCLAPVCRLSGAGRGLNSRIAMHRLTGLVYEAAKRGPVYLIIKTKNV
ncbi:MAG TPA: hypothetical protein VGE66_08165, partial [Chitinophagaceae bacterium]